MRGPRGFSVTLALVASTAAWLPAPTARAVPDGWAGDVLLDPTGNDWEPAIAADPAGPRLYALVTRFGAPCADRCPDPALFLLASADGGETWGSAHRLCPCPGAAQQWDPQIEVAGDGTVYAAWLQKEGPSPPRRSSARTTWSTPVRLSASGGGAAYRDSLGFVSPCGDYGEIVVVASGRTVAVWGEGIGPPPGPGGSWFAREA